MKISAIVLAAGKGTRMGSLEKPKVMFSVLGKPIIDHSVSNIKKSGIDEIVLVVGYKKEMVMDYFHDQVSYAEQIEQLGTGHAVMTAENILKGKSDGVLVCYGDMPLFLPQNIQKLVKIFEEEKPAIAMLTAVMENPHNYGRIVRDKNGAILKNVEEKDCDAEQKKIKEINPCFYIFDNKWLWQNLKKLKTNNAQNEYYLTDLIALAKDEGAKVSSAQVDYEWEALGINTQDQLKQVEEIILREKEKPSIYTLRPKKMMNIGLINKNNQILLAMKKRGFGEGWWNGYGGKIKPGESIELALEREIKEEAGIKIVKYKKRGVLTFETQNEEELIEVHLYHILEYEGEPQESEEMLPKWFSVDAIPFDSMWPDDKHWMPLFLAGKNFEGKFLFDKEKNLLDFELEEI